MAHSRAWDDSYEALPTDDSYGYEIDNYIRQVIQDVRERMEIDHVWKIGTDTDGIHNKLTMPVQTTDPTAVESTGFVYTKDVDDKAELFYLDEDGNAVQLSDGGLGGAASGIIEQGNNGDELKVKVIDIGDWNMDSTNSAVVAHGLTLANIRGVQVIIRNDDNDNYGDIRGHSTTIDGYFRIGAVNINIYRVASGVFDLALFDATSYNRGWVTIWYKV